MADSVHDGSEPIDSLGMRAAMLALPEQIEASLAELDVIPALPNAASIEHVLILGMGDSGFGGDVAAASARPFSSKPIVVYGGYLPPSWVGPNTLVIAMSASGSTEETLESLEAAVESGASLVAITNGGELKRLAERAGAPTLPVVGDAPMPRAALGALATPAMLTLEQAGFFPGARSWLVETIQQLRIRRESFDRADSEPRELARRIGDTMPLIYGGGAIGTTAARRWKVAFNHNVKRPAFWAPMPDLCHNELVGFGQRGDVTRNLFTQIQLRHDSEHPQTARRFEYVGEKTVGVMHEVVTVTAGGDGPVSQLFDLVYTGDITTLELAAAEGLDPGPLPVVEELKEWLGSEPTT